MRLIVMGDIHGNIEALNSVIEESITTYGKNIDGFIFLGDYCCDFLEGKECIERIRDLKKYYPVYVISGNRETAMVKKYYEAKLIGEKVQWNIETTMGAPLLSCERMTMEELEYLSKLPDKVILNLEGAEPLYLQHKMPLSDEVRKILERRGIKNILGAHTHEAHMNTYDGFNFFNPGSVGLTDMGKQGASYGVMTFKNGHWMMELRLAEYNYEAAIERVNSNPLLIDKCEHWGKLLIASIQNGVNANSMYAYEKSRIAKLYAENKDNKDYEIKEIPFGVNRGGNTGPTNDYLREFMITGSNPNEIKTVTYKTVELLPKKEEPIYPIEDWMKDLALQNILNFLENTKKEKSLESVVYTARRF